MTDSTSLIRVIEQVQPDELYNLAAQSHVAVSFEEPEYTGNTDALGALRLLEAIRILGLQRKTRYYQASTSELYGLVREIPQRETTPFYPRSPYGVAKLYAHWITVNYREAYDLYACNGILFKARRDWGHARDYVEAQWLMLQQERPDDYVIATGQSRSVREFVDVATARLGIRLVWEGQGAEQVGRVESCTLDAAPPLERGKVIVRVDPRYLRPSEVDALVGDASKARSKLGWSPRIGFEQLVQEMIDADFEAAQRDSLIRAHGYSAPDQRE